MEFKNFYKNKKPGIYCILNTINNKKYIGSAVNVYARLQGHKSLLIRNKHTNIHLQRAWNKYGEENFVCSILENCDFLELKSREQYYINIYSNLYNIMLDVERFKHSDESKEKMSNTWKNIYKNNTQEPHRKIKLFLIDSFGAIINTWETVKEASLETGISESVIYRNLRGIKVKFKNFKFIREKDLNKQDELLENPITVSEDNQQPSLSSNTLEGSTTNSQVLNKDGNADTSVLPFKWIDYDEYVLHTTGKLPIKGDNIV